MPRVDELRFADLVAVSLIDCRIADAVPVKLAGNPPKIVALLDNHGFGGRDATGNCTGTGVDRHARRLQRRNLDLAFERHLGASDHRAAA